MVHSLLKKISHYSKGQCTWGASCRFVHPGVLDKGNYNMFAPPRPILPTDQEPIEKVNDLKKIISKGLNDKKCHSHLKIHCKSVQGVTIKQRETTVSVGNICKYNPIAFVGKRESPSELHAFYMESSVAQGISVIILGNW